MNKERGTVLKERYSEEELDVLENFILANYGTFENVIHEISSPDIHVDICIIPPAEQRNYYTLVTMGMGAHRMNVPGELNKSRLERAEVLICLPPDWKLLDEDERWYWPVRWLKLLARLPIEEDSWLGWGHSIQAGGPFSKDTELAGIMLTSPAAFGGEAGVCVLSPDKQISFYQIVPLYSEELDFKVKYGAEALMERMSAAMLTVADPGRKNVCPYGAAAESDEEVEETDLIPTFLERADEFWEWFEENEAVLADMTCRQNKYGADAVADFLSEGAELISEEVHLIANGPCELAFTAAGELHLFYLLPWLAERLPEKFKEKWRVLPFLPGNGCALASFGIYGVQLNVSDVLVGVKYDEAENHFELCFYGRLLNELKENQAYNAFYLLLESCIGEGFSQVYVYDVKKAEQPEPDMIPLCSLRDIMCGTVRAAGRKTVERPDQNFVEYEEEVRNPEGLRDDIYRGITCFCELLDDYHAEEQEIVDALEEYGARALFLCFSCGTPDRREAVRVRTELEARIEKEVLGERGSGRESGILLGGADGLDYAYIDILVYDIHEFMKNIRALLAEYPWSFTLNEFHRGAEPYCF